MSGGNEKLVNLMKDKREDYMGSKYSQHVFGNEGVLEDKSSINNHAPTAQDETFWDEISDNDSMQRRQTMADKQRVQKKEKVISSSRIFEELHPSSIIRSLYNLTNLTPEEIETLIIIKKNFLTKWRNSTLIFYGITIPLMFYMRSYLRKSFVVFTLITGAVFGFFAGHFQNAKPTMILLDKLGKEYELSRYAKQSLFSRRKDISTETKAEVYFHLNKKNQEIEEAFKKAFNDVQLLKDFEKI